jgi:hypothetical protein
MKINEAQLRKIIQESVKKVLNEEMLPSDYEEKYPQYFGRKFKDDNEYSPNDQYGDYDYDTFNYDDAEHDGVIESLEEYYNGDFKGDTFDFYYYASSYMLDEARKTKDKRIYEELIRCCEHAINKKGLTKKDLKTYIYWETHDFNICRDGVLDCINLAKNELQKLSNQSQPM